MFGERGFVLSAVCSVLMLLLVCAVAVAVGDSRWDVEETVDRVVERG